MIKRVVFILSVVSILILCLVSLSQSTDEFDVDAEEPTEEQNQQTLSEAVAADPAVTYTEPTEEEPATYDVSQTTTDLTVTTIPEDVAITTDQGTIIDFSMTNALFSLGSLIQGSFISFTNNNNIYFKSLFDASTFVATLDNGSSVDIGQRNSFGDMGKVIITLDGGNLTQDQSIIFVPQGNEPTYIYYNTTQIEFKDGDIYLLGESITNNDDTQDTTTVSFDENGFSKLELHPENTYTINDKNLTNTGDSTLIICKKDPLCDINIDESTFTIQGKVNFSYKGEVIYESRDENNEAVLDFSAKTITTNNPLPKSETLSIIFNGHIKLTETKNQLYFLPQEKEYPNTFTSYTSLLQSKTLTLEDDALFYENFSAFLPESSYYQPCFNDQESCTLQPETIQQAPERTTNIYPFFAAIFICILLSIFLFPKRKKNKKGQFTLFVVLGFVLVMIVLIFFLLYEQKSTATEITQIKSLEDARVAVETCITETIEKDINTFGEHGGYVTENQYSFSSFNTSYELLSLIEQKGNLQTAIERSINDCGSVLENTPYTLIVNQRTGVTVDFGEELSITGDSLGTVQDQSGTNSETVGEIKQSEEINIPEIYTMTQELLNGEEGIPISSPEGYEIHIFTSKDYKEMLIEVQQQDPKFRWRITKKM